MANQAQTNQPTQNDSTMEERGQESSSEDRNRGSQGSQNQGSQSNNRGSQGSQNQGGNRRS